jgi:hypothetical protein
MQAYKFLAAGSRGPFSGHAWTAADWTEAEGPLEPCWNGVHALSADALAPWLDEELWAIELDGEIVRADGLLVGRRGRLVERVEDWDGQAAGRFARACARHAQEISEGTDAAQPYADMAASLAETTADARTAATVAFMAVRAAEETDAHGWDTERAWQSHRFAADLGL